MHGLKQSTGLVPTTVIDTLVAVHEASLSAGRSLNQQLSAIFEHLLLSLCYKFRHHRPCLFANVRWDVVLPEDMELQVRRTLFTVLVPVAYATNSHGYHDDVPVAYATNSHGNHDERASLPGQSGFFLCVVGDN